MFEDDYLSPMVPNYPPYNIVITGKNKYDIEVALAGYSKKDIKVDYEDGLLTIKSAKTEKDESKDDDGNILHKGIAKRYFSKSFTTHKYESFSCFQVEITLLNKNINS